MTCSQCRSETTDSLVKVEEGRRSAVFRNHAREVFHRTRVDGCLVKNATAADFVVSKAGVGSVIVELKGTDVEHAVAQVSATVAQLKACDSNAGLMPYAGLVICSRYPRFDTKLQRLLKRFVAVHKVPLHVVAKDDEFDLNRVLAFDGPR